MNKATRIVHGVALEVACYQGERDFLLRLSHALPPVDRVNDAFVPPGEIGFLWIREVGASWIVSGMVRAASFPQLQDVRDFVDWALKNFANVDESVHARVERVDVVDELRASMEE